MVADGADGGNTKNGEEAKSASGSGGRFWNDDFSSPAKAERRAQSAGPSEQRSRQTGGAAGMNGGRSGIGGGAMGGAVNARRGGLLFVALACAAPLTAQAPVPIPQPAGAGSLVGIVVDTLGRRLDSVRVYAPLQNRNTRTNSIGEFRLNGLPENHELQVGFLKIGYESQTLLIKLDKGGGAMRVAMTPIPRVLPRVVTEARQVGLRGVVSDSLLQPLKGAHVAAVPSGAGAAITDARGGFRIDAKPGSYMVTVSLNGHETRLMSVTVPKEGGREIAIALRPIVDKGRHARNAWSLDNMRWRLLRKWGPFQRLYTNEDLATFADYDLRQLAQRSTAMRVDEQCMASIDGDPMESTPIWALYLHEFEAVEVYGSPVLTPGGNAPRGVTSINGNRQITQPQRARQLFNQSLGCPDIIVWTKK